MYTNKGKFEKTPKKGVSKLVTFASYNKYGVKFNVADRSIKMKNYLNKLAISDRMPYRIFQQDHVWYIKIGKNVYEFSNSLFLF